MNSLNRFFARALPALTLVAWAAVLLYFYFSGRLRPYVTEQFRTMCLIAGILLPIVAGGLLFTGRGVVVAPEDECDPVTFGNASSRPDARLRGGQWLAFLILMVPIYAATAMTTDSFSGNAVRNRGIVTDSSVIPQSAASFTPLGAAPATASAKSAPAAAPTAAQRAPLEPPLPTADGSAPPTTPLDPTQRVDATQYLKKAPGGAIVAEVVDFLFAADNANDRGDFEGKKFEVIGQFLPAQDSKLKFQLVRMFMFCCAADSRPVAITVEAPGSLEPTAEMSWVKVNGTMTFRAGPDGKFAPLLRADRITKTEPPQEAMLY